MISRLTIAMVFSATLAACYMPTGEAEETSDATLALQDGVPGSARYTATGLGPRWDGEAGFLVRYLPGKSVWRRTPSIASGLVGPMDSTDPTGGHDGPYLRVYDVDSGHDVQVQERCGAGIIVPADACAMTSSATATLDLAFDHAADALVGIGVPPLAPSTHGWGMTYGDGAVSTALAFVGDGRWINAAKCDGRECGAIETMDTCRIAVKIPKGNACFYRSQ